MAPSTPLLRLIPLSVVLISGMALSLASHTSAQNSAPLSEVQFDPSDVYLQGYLACREAEKLTESGDHIRAAEKYRKADELFSTVKKFYPDWKPQMVERRHLLTSQGLADATEKAKNQLNQKRSVVAELEGGVKTGAESPVPGSNPAKPSILEVDPLLKRKLAEAEAESERLKKLVQQQKNESAEESKRLRQQALAERTKAEEEIKRLEQLTRDNNAEANKKVKQLQQLAIMAQANAAAEVEKIKKLTGKEKEDAQAELARLRALAARANNDADKELKKQQSLMAESNQAAEKKIQELRRLVAQSKAEADAETARLKTLVEQQKQEAEESKRLRELALNERAKAEEEIKRLEQLTRETNAEANEKVKQLQQLATMAQANAAAEVEKIKKLSGKEKAEAQAELDRLRALADKANADADLEIKKQKDLMAKSNRAAEEKIKELRLQAARSKAEADAELERLKQITEGVKADAEASKRALSMSENRSKIEINNLTVAKTALERRLRASEANVQKLRARLASAPLQSEMDQLNAKIKGLEEERNAMAMALQQSNAGYSAATKRITELESELLESKQKAANLTRNIEAEREIANSVVAGQRKQLLELTEELEKKSKELESANNTIAGLKVELKQSRDAFTQLQTERDALLAERDQMAALLKLNEGGRIQDLINQNMGLAKKLRESNEKLDRLYNESNADKDKITEALRDLAIAKSQINSLREDKIKQEQRLLDLQQKLEEEQKRLASAPPESDPAEVAVLRDIIKRQLRLQKRKQQAREILISTVKNLSSEDEQLAEAVKILDSPNLVLTPEEQKLVADRQVDGEFISPFARDRDVVNQQINQLERDIEVFDRAAKKAFLAGRLLPTRELYEMILDQHPGHTPTMCKIGVVHLKLKDPEAATDSFRRAIELDTKNAYAYRMFGYCLMLTGEVEDAEKAVRKSIDLDPNDGKAHMLLGSLCYQEGRDNEAESHFKGAINADPLPSEPYYNLAVIYSETGRMELAQDYYQKALKRGAVPDAELENAMTIR